MPRKTGLVLGVIVVAIVAGFIAWQLAGRGWAPVDVVEAPAPPPEAEPVAKETVPAEEADESFDDIDDIIAETGQTGSALAPVKEREKVTSDPECVRILAEMKEKLGWDKVHTMKFVINGVTESMGNRIESRTDVMIEKPGKSYSTTEANVPGEGSLSMCTVTDGVFAESGTISSGGTRQPRGRNDAQPVSPGSPDLFDGITDPTVLEFVSAETITPDPGDPLFQRSDGSPPEQKELTLLTAHSGTDGTIELFLDPASMEIVAVSILKNGAKQAALRRIEYKEISPGIRAPVAYDFSLNMEKMLQQLPENAREGMPSEVTTRFTHSDVEVNIEIAPETFYFTNKPGQ